MMPRWHIAASELGVAALSLRKGVTRRSTPRGEHARATRWRTLAARELRAYFAGRLRFFSTRCDLGALPPFSLAVLNLTAKIPYGETRSYQWLARRLGRPRAARAVGNALARNPLPILIPCHRVVRADGTFDAFVLGPAWKKRLQRLERKVCKNKSFAGISRHASKLS